MCENFVCVRLPENQDRIGSAKHVLPEPCYEHANCQICEFMYDCDFCAIQGMRSCGSPRTADKTKKIPKDTPKKN